VNAVAQQFANDKEASALLSREPRKPWTYDAM
jgi:hypothetical protein